MTAEVTIAGARERGAGQRPILTGVVAASAVGAVAAALWLWPASVQIVAWPAGGPERVAYFAPLVRLWWIAAGAAVALVLIRSSWRPAIVRALAPLQWLWLWAVPFVPVLPDRFPLLLVLEGRLRWAIAIGALAGVAVRVGQSTGASIRVPQAHRRTIFALSLVLYLAAGFAWNGAVGFGGDEPHYLVIAQSLLADHDLNIENNHANREYLKFYPGTLRPDYLARGRHGEIYSIHAPGLPAVLLPAYAAGGGRGALVLVVFIGALAAAAIFEAARLIGGMAAGWFTWAAVCLTVPFLPHAWLIYPEGTAGLIVAWAVCWLLRPMPDRRWTWLARGATAAVLPWLHTKYALLLAPIAVFAAVDVWRRERPARRLGAVAAFALPIAVSVAGWFVSFYVMYGVFDPQAPYGSFAAETVNTANVVRGVLGLFLDQKFGLLVYAPVYLLAALGIGALARRPDSRLLAAAVVVTTVLFVASTARFYMWWGGASAPARFLVPILPLLAVPMGIAARRWRRTAAVTLAISLGVSLPSIADPAGQWLLSDPHGSSRILTWLQGSAPLTAAWPTFTEPEWQWRPARALSALVGRFDAAARTETVERGRERLLAHFDTTLRAFDYQRRARADAAFVLAHAALQATKRDRQLNEDPARLAGPFGLAAGTYAVRVWFAGEPAEAFVQFHEGPSLATLVPSRTSDAVVGNLSLPVDAPLMWVGVADAATAARVIAVDVVPLSIVPAGARPAVDPIAIEPLEGGGVLVYADRNSYPEKGVFWTRGSSTASVLVAPQGAAHLTATLHLGPNTGTVHLTVAGKPWDVPVPPGGTADLTVPADPAAAVIPVTVAAPSSFVPALTDPKSDDLRRLGCQVRIRVR